MAKKKAAKKKATKKKATKKKKKYAQQYWEHQAEADKYRAENKFADKKQTAAYVAQGEANQRLIHEFAQNVNARAWGGGYAPAASSATSSPQSRSIGDGVSSGLKTAGETYEKIDAVNNSSDVVNWVEVNPSTITTRADTARAGSGAASGHSVEA